MSGIFGLSVTKKNMLQLDACLDCLNSGNLIYGAINNKTRFETNGIGICSDNTLYLNDELIVGENNSFCVVDATIYNRCELLKELGYDLNSNISDSKIVYLLIKSQGMLSLKKINGDFAGALFENGKWIVFRDHMGIRPLYYYLKDGAFVFSSDIRPIITLPIVDKHLDDEKLFLEWTGHNKYDAFSTDFKYVKCVKAGTWIQIEMNKNAYECKENIYWKPGTKKIKYKKTDRYFKELNKLIYNSIDIRAKKFGKSVGTELSGGLDSGVIAIVLRKLGYEVRGISWSDSPDLVPIQDIDERKVIQDICNQESITCDYVDYKTRKLNEIAESDMPPFVNTLLLSDTAKYFNHNGYKVVFTGQGGDEGVSHRADVLELWYNKEYIKFFKEIYYSTQGCKHRFLRTIKRSYKKVKNVYPSYFKPWKNKYMDLSDYMQEDFNKRLRNIKGPVRLFGIDPAFFSMNGGQRSRLDNVAFQSAENGVRYVFPYLDYRVFDYAVSIPRWLFCHNGKERYIYYETFKNIMPKSLQQVDYKNFPSLSNYKTPQSEIDRYTLEKKQILSLLDKSIWSKYWNFDKMEVALNKNDSEMSKNESENVDELFNQLVKCLLIQNLIRK